MKKTFWKNTFLLVLTYPSVLLVSSCAQSKISTDEGIDNGGKNKTPKDPNGGSSSDNLTPPSNTNPVSPSKAQEGELGGIEIGGGGGGGASPNEIPRGPQGAIPGRPDISVNEYQKLSTEKKNQVDLQAYTKALKGALGDLSYTSQQSPIKDQAQVKAYDDKALKADQPEYESALLRNFSIVKDNKLFLNPISKKLSAAYWDSAINNRGLSRYLPNQKYKDIALQSYAIKFNDGNDLISQNDGFSEKGTAWILDYQLDSSGYPTKWYLATNLHVASQLLKQTVDSNYSNITNLAEEKKEYDDTIKRKTELEKIYTEIVKPFREKLATIDKEIDRLKIEKNKADTDGRSSDVKKYNDLIAKQQDLKVPIFKEENAKVAQEFDNKYGIEYNQLSDKLKGKFKGTTKNIALEHFNEETPIDQDLLTNDKAFTVDVFYLKPEQVKIVYGANDFLNSSPKDYLPSDSPYKDTEELADFAVLEVDFTSRDNSPYKYWSRKENKEITVNSASELAKKATSDFANWDASRKFKFATNSLYKDWDKNNSEQVEVTTQENKKVKIPKSSVNLLALGFPNSATDNQIDTAYKPKEFVDALKWTQSIWVNKPIYTRSEFAVAGKVTTKDYGSGFSKAFGLRNFLSKPGISDYTITAPIITAAKNEPFSMPYFKDTKSKYQGKSYINYGLGYTLASWQPLTGASGSSVRTMDNQIVGINFATGDELGNSLTSLVQAFRSEGIDYSGFYGSYKLEQYDLIYGGGKNQRTSYRQALHDYNKDAKTYLFPNGTDEAHIPSEYKFNN
ncbi:MULTISPECIES: Ig-specific serine endopeptidase MIP [unclassified Mycoplasma]|uniref:Ig-specific serine endopeptidase MIP n=1 Tax=unclassified Mycoplasma TaxID=2683645 RepID=UPI00211B7D61|nr:MULTISPECIES: DUF31 family protein [unclassified Mycoplasma]UUM19669.1 DUF31 family protein [Mycoplasma sp. 1578d]UUM24637.1 DUF31 family protein [Mycoplasma sp. 3686d]